VAAIGKLKKSRFHTASVKFARASVGFGGAACPSTPEIGPRPANYAERQQQPLTDVLEIAKNGRNHAGLFCFHSTKKIFDYGQKRPD
jgi:hypothetical protein